MNKKKEEEEERRQGKRKINNITVVADVNLPQVKTR